MLGRAFFAVVVVYVTLDLSLPSMPGAFVFDADETVESVHGHRRGGTGPVMTPTTQAAASSVSLAPVPVTKHRPALPRTPMLLRRIVHRPPRAALDVAPSDDSSAIRS